MYGYGEVAPYGEGSYKQDPSSVNFAVNERKLYGTDYCYTSEFPNASKTDRCYRAPVKKGDGFGPSEYKDSQEPGFDWLWPPARVGCAKCLDPHKREIALVFDAKTQRHWQVNDLENWQDRMSAGEYKVAKDIWSELWLPGKHAAQGENVPNKHTESWAFFDPYDRRKRGQEGFDQLGFMENFAIDWRLMKNGEPSKHYAEAMKVPIGDEGQPADVVFDAESEAASHQIRLRMRAAGYWLKGVKSQYETIDKAAPPDLRKMTETTYDEHLASSPLFRVSRNYYPLRNLATGADITAPGTTTTLKGPDGYDYSAINVSGGISDTSPEDVDGDFSALIWNKLMGTTTFPCRIWKTGNLEIQIMRISSRYTLAITGAVPYRQIALNTLFPDWVFLAIIREGLYIHIYEGSTLLERYAIESAENYGNTIQCADNSDLSLFDPTLLPVAITGEEVAWYVKDVLSGGAKCLPPF